MHCKLIINFYQHVFKKIYLLVIYIINDIPMHVHERAPEHSIEC